jgi:hypothetical protein
MSPSKTYKVKRIPPRVLAFARIFFNLARSYDAAGVFTSAAV